MFTSTWKLTSFVLAVSCGLFSQVTDGPHNFAGTNSTQVVSVQQNGTGSGIRAIAKGQSSQAVRGVATSTTGANYGVRGVSLSQSGTGVLGEATKDSGRTFGVHGITSSPKGAGVEGDSETPFLAGIGVVGRFSGDQGIGVLGINSGDPAAPINPIGVMGVIGTDVAGGSAGVFENDNDCIPTLPCTEIGDILQGRSNSTVVFRVDPLGKVFADGGFSTGGADFAESVRVQGSRQRYSPGDLLQIDDATDMQLKLANTPYSRSVVGIYSTAPGIVASPHKIADAPVSDEVPLAVVGIVPCKVSTENGAIHRGDLLVTSSTAGYAMRGTDVSRLTGAVVGKAMQSFDSGKGMIQVLVTLQ